MSVWVEIADVTATYDGVTVTLHVSVWVEITSQSLSTPTVSSSRSTWACELKWIIVNVYLITDSHAPRERVSWNFAKITYINNCSSHAPRERVSWNNISWALLRNSTLSRSTWACELKSERSSFSGMVIASRSTWACELKSQYLRCSFQAPRHAPRERVSWNCDKLFWVFRSVCHAPRERVSWNVCAFLTENFARSHAPRERVSWNSNSWRCYRYRIRHAPRERVSWNFQPTIHQRIATSRSTWACELKSRISRSPQVGRQVTLHVSVWVEIGRLSHSALRLSGSRSTWACELKFDGKGVKNENVTSRSTWACELKCMSSGAGACALSRHAPRERVSWNGL